MGWFLSHSRISLASTATSIMWLVDRGYKWQIVASDLWLVFYG